MTRADGRRRRLDVDRAHLLGAAVDRRKVRNRAANRVARASRKANRR